MRQAIIALCLASISVVTVMTWASFGVAHKGATGVVKHRMDMMKDIGKETKTLKSILSGQADYNAAKVKQSAHIIKKHAIDILPYFPKGSLDHPTEAKPHIWTDWNRFETQMQFMGAYADALMVAANNPSDPRYYPEAVSPENLTETGWVQPAYVKTLPPQAAFLYMSQTCRVCHKAFREKR